MSSSKLIHFKPKHHELLLSLGFKQNHSGYYNSQNLDSIGRSEMESQLKQMKFDHSDSIDKKVRTFKHEEYPDLEIHFRKTGASSHSTYVTSKNHQPSITQPKQGDLF